MSVARCACAALRLQPDTLRAKQQRPSSGAPLPSVVHTATTVINACASAVQALSSAEHEVRCNSSNNPVLQPSSATLAFAVQMLTSAEYKVHYNSNRLGVRLTGPKPAFARPDGGDGGGHPSNVHNAVTCHVRRHVMTCHGTCHDVP
jgi:allophanate hydrolase subunit 2